jgi:hypothetical protein
MDNNDTGKEYFYEWTSPLHPHRTRWLYILGLVLYFCASIVAPAIIVGCTYHVFTSKSSGITGGMLFLLACALWIVLAIFKKKIKLLGESKRNIRTIKYVIQFLLEGGGWAIFAWLCWAERGSLDTFFITCFWVAICECIAKGIDKLWVADFEHYFACMNKAIENDSLSFLSNNRKHK